MNSHQQRNPTKKFCKVCFDAGKPESVYTNHTVKTMDVRSGKLETTCVTLLALECRYCFKTGHTVKFCLVLAENQKNTKNREINRAKYNHKVEEERRIADVKASVVVKKGFALLEEDSSDDEKDFVDVKAIKEEKEVLEKQFPSLMTKSGESQLKVVFGYAQIAALPAAPVKKVVQFKKEEPKWVEEVDSDEEEQEVYVEEIKYVKPLTQADFDSYRAPVYNAEDDDW
jgi:hypothetical protein